MRVSGGNVKGARLKTLSKRSVRPTTSVARQAIFSLLANRTNKWHYVLDLYAGSGALGIEALSRGAGWVDFVEHKPRCCDIIKQNLEKTKLITQAHVYCCSVVKAFSFLDKEYSIILIDPPYSDSSIGSLVEQLATSNLVGASSKGHYQILKKQETEIIHSV